ncbi:MAG: hypothetical protein HYY83_12635, partial [Deltaproteobacteria bacterium]|nr:hypothetical protein [Deltaproteobacteria bacterium]
MPLIGRLALFVCLILSARAAPAQGAGGEIGIQTFPLLKQARPLAEPVRTVLIVLDSSGRALKTGTAHIRLVAPTPGRFFSTDFPMIEGTPLFEMELPVRQGRATWEYVFPIRGVYRLEVRATGEEGTEIEAGEHEFLWVLDPVFQTLLLDRLSFGCFPLVTYFFLCFAALAPRNGRRGVPRWIIWSGIVATATAVMAAC